MSPSPTGTSFPCKCYVKGELLGSRLTGIVCVCVCVCVTYQSLNKNKKNKLKAMAFQIWHQIAEVLMTNKGYLISFQEHFNLLQASKASKGWF